MKKVQHEKSATEKTCNMKKCNLPQRSTEKCKKIVANWFIMDYVYFNGFSCWLIVLN